MINRLKTLNFMNEECRAHINMINIIGDDGDQFRVDLVNLLYDAVEITREAGQIDVSSMVYLCVCMLILIETLPWTLRTPWCTNAASMLTFVADDGQHWGSIRVYLVLTLIVLGIKPHLSVLNRGCILYCMQMWPIVYPGKSDLLDLIWFYHVYCSVCGSSLFSLVSV